MRSAVHLRPSLQQADCLCHWRQQVTQRCGERERERERGERERETASRRENCALASGSGLRGSRSAPSILSLYLPFAFLLYSPKLIPWTRPSAPGVPLPREDRVLSERESVFDCVCVFSVCVCVCACACGLPHFNCQLRRITRALLLLRRKLVGNLREKKIQKKKKNTGGCSFCSHSFFFFPRLFWELSLKAMDLR